MTVVTDLLIRGSRCDRAISAAEIEAIKRQPGHYSATLWDKIADWFCGTRKADALKALAETCDDSKPFDERTTAFSKLKAFSAETYQDRFHTRLNQTGMTLSITGNNDGKLVEISLTSPVWQNAWDKTSNTRTSNEEREHAFRTLQLLAGQASQDRFQITLSHKGLQFTVTDQPHPPVLQVTLTSRPLVSAWNTLHNEQATPDERVEAFSTLQRLTVSQLGHNRFHAHPTQDGLALSIMGHQHQPVFQQTTQDGLELSIMDHQHQPVFQQTLIPSGWADTWTTLKDANKPFDERREAFSTLQRLTGEAGKDHFHTDLHGQGIDLSISAPQDKTKTVFKATLTSNEWHSAWQTMMNKDEPLNKRMLAFGQVKMMAGTPLAHRFKEYSNITWITGNPRSGLAAPAVVTLLSSYIIVQTVPCKKLPKLPELPELPELPARVPLPECPISFGIDENTEVCLVHDKTDERAVTLYNGIALQEWFDTKCPPTSPLTRKELSRIDLVQPDDLQYYEWTTITDGNVLALKPGYIRQNGRVVPSPVTPVTPVTDQATTHSQVNT